MKELELKYKAQAADAARKHEFSMMLVRMPVDEIQARGLQAAAAAAASYSAGFLAPGPPAADAPASSPAVASVESEDVI
jgi:hypothetical protein